MCKWVFIGLLGYFFINKLIYFGVFLLLIGVYGFKIVFLVFIGLYFVKMVFVIGRLEIMLFLGRWK